MNYTLYTKSNTKLTIDLPDIDTLVNYLMHDGILVLAVGQGVFINNQLNDSLGSIRIDDDTLAYYGKSFIITQNDSLNVTTLAIYKKGTFPYNRLLGRKV